MKYLKNKNSALLWLAIFSSGIMIFVSGEMDIMIHILALSILTIMACVLQKWDIYHPFVWYSTFFWIYSCAYPILYVTGYKTTYGYSKEMMFYQWLALTTILLILPIGKVTFEKRKINSERGYRQLFIVNNMVLIYILFATWLILRSPYKNKVEIYSSRNLLFNIAFSLTYFAILLYCHMLFQELSRSSNKKYHFLIFKSGVVICLFAIVTGERDYLFSFILLTLVILFAHNKISTRQLVFFVPIGMALVPLSDFFKYYILTKDLSGEITTQGFLYKILDGEFISAGRNLQILIEHDCENYWGGKSLLNDFIRIFYNTGYSNQTWFNQTFFSHSKSTLYGFTLVGEGYVNGGIFGVIIVFAICGFLLRILYRNASKNKYFMTIYLYMIPLFIYSIRADLANIFSPLIKYALLGSGVIWILQHLVVKKKEG